MKRGIIGTGNGNLPSMQSYTSSHQNHGMTLNECVEVGPTSSVSTPNGNQITVQTGRALAEVANNVSKPTVQNGSIQSTNTWEKVASVTDFILCPNEFIIIGDTSGKFFFDILGSRNSISVTRPTIDLDAYAQTRPNALPWKYGFSNLGGNADKGVVYGTDLPNDPNMGTILQQSNKNQLGLEFQHNGRQTKMEVSASGFVRIMEPAAGSDDLAAFVSDELQPHW